MIVNEINGLNIDEIIESYIEAALWISTDNNDTPLDSHYLRDDIAPESMETITTDIIDFVVENSDYIRMWDDYNTTPEQQCGHDLWFTRNGHGVGFWESEWTDLEGNPGAVLDAAAKAMGSQCVYVGNNGLLDFS